jgi:hypothetical protein
VGKHYDRTINELNVVMSSLTEGIQVLPSSERLQLTLATTAIASVLADIDINLAAIADALEEKKDDNAST